MDASIDSSFLASILLSELIVKSAADKLHKEVGKKLVCQTIKYAKAVDGVNEIMRMHRNTKCSLRDCIGSDFSFFLCASL